MTSDEIRLKKKMMSWTMYVMEAVSRAKKTKQTVTLHVGKESTYVITRCVIVISF